MAMVPTDRFEVEFAFDEAECREGETLLASHRAGAGLLSQLQGLLLGIIIGMSSVISLLGWGDTSPITRGAFALVAVLGIAHLIVSWKMRARLSEPHYHPKSTFAATEELAIVRQPEGEHNFNWSALKQIQQSERLLALQFTPTQWLFLPKRAFSAEQLDQFRDLLRRKLPAEKLPTPFGDMGR